MRYPGALPPSAVSLHPMGFGSPPIVRRLTRCTLGSEGLGQRAEPSLGQRGRVPRELVVLRRSGRRSDTSPRDRLTASPHAASGGAGLEGITVSCSRLAPLACFILFSQR